VLMPPQYFMECALSLAKLAMGYTSPNPAVGAVVVKDGLVVGMGYTQPVGSEHAEVMALRQAGDRAKDAALYVTLEPCSHYGRTPPCTEAIIAAGISEVYIALVDPNPMVSGSGIGKLNQEGIRTHVGIGGQEARDINEAYIKHITTGLPFVVAKFAMSLDGKIATRTGDSKWITSEEARNYAHALRSTFDAIMVGVNTVVADNPHLTAKGCGGRGGIGKTQPLRLIVDSEGRIPVNSHVFEPPGELMVAVAKPFDPVRRQELVQAGAEVMEVSAKRRSVDIGELLRLLGKREVVTVLVEGGGKLLGSLFDQRLVDKVLAFVSPVIIGGREAASVGGNGVERMAEALRLSRVDIKVFGHDILVSGYAGQASTPSG
jgi:diaminohydroxyphosphoribosylaminopyrimidine deaminase / 5-amino-6-(5-phosphoribosylamino)uracil reductase